MIVVDCQNFECLKIEDILWTRDSSHSSLFISRFNDVGVAYCLIMPPRDHSFLFFGPSQNLYDAANNTCKGFNKSEERIISRIFKLHSHLRYPKSISSGISGNEFNFFVTRASQINNVIDFFKTQETTFGNLCFYKHSGEAPSIFTFLYHDLHFLKGEKSVEFAKYMLTYKQSLSIFEIRSSHFWLRDFCAPWKIENSHIYGIKLLRHLGLPLHHQMVKLRLRSLGMTEDSKKTEIEAQYFMEAIGYLKDMGQRYPFLEWTFCD